MKRNSEIHIKFTKQNQREIKTCTIYYLEGISVNTWWASSLSTFMPYFTNTIWVWSSQALNPWYPSWQNMTSRWASKSGKGETHTHQIGRPCLGILRYSISLWRGSGRTSWKRNQESRGADLASRGIEVDRDRWSAEEVHRGRTVEASSSSSTMGSSSGLPQLCMEE